MRAWPEGVPREALDYDRLARLNLSGGNIATVALNAAFMAAAADGLVTMLLVLAAARAEILARPYGLSFLTAEWRGSPEG